MVVFMLVVVVVLIVVFMLMVVVVVVMVMVGVQRGGNVPMPSRSVNQQYKAHAHACKRDRRRSEPMYSWMDARTTSTVMHLSRLNDTDRLSTRVLVLYARLLQLQPARIATDRSQRS